MVITKSFVNVVTNDFEAGYASRSLENQKKIKDGLLGEFTSWRVGKNFELLHIQFIQQMDGRLELELIGEVPVNEWINGIY